LFALIYVGLFSGENLRVPGFFFRRISTRLNTPVYLYA
jgi:hypothetical protein